jgi:hypothetical protein
VAFLKGTVHVLDGLNPVPMEFRWGILELMLGFLQVMDGRLDPRVMMLRRRTSRGCAGSSHGHTWPRSPRLRVKNEQP